MVMVFAAHDAVTPAGRLTGVPIPVAPKVVWVIAVRGVLIQSVGVAEGGVTVLFALTVMKSTFVSLFDAPSVMVNDTVLNPVVL
jgi:hypothetical protein